MPTNPDPFVTLLGYQLRRLSQLVMADLAATLEPLQLRPAEASTMFAIGMREGQTQSDIGRKLGIKRANMAPLIAGLEKRGAIVRAAVDGRSQSLQLTAAGAELRERARAAIDAHETRVFATLSVNEREARAADLSRLLKDAEQRLGMLYRGHRPD